MRTLKHHEKQLLKKVDFLQWKQDSNLREVKVMRRYHIQNRFALFSALSSQPCTELVVFGANREDYAAYNRLAGGIRSLAHKIQALPERDPYRAKAAANLLSKLYDMSLLDVTAQINDIEAKITVSAFCRRRLAVVMCQRKMCQSVSMAVKFIEQGHVRVGPDTMTDPAFLVTR